MHEFWCMVARWCAHTSSSELAAAMVAWFSASVETEGREEANEGSSSEWGWLWGLLGRTLGLPVGVRPPGGVRGLVLSVTEPRSRWPSDLPFEPDSKILALKNS
jgi:hypothetical protein